MKQLVSDIKTKNFKSVYLFFGEEKYLVRHYENALREALIPPEARQMNVSVFDGKKAAVDTVIDAASTAPFLAEHRLVVVRDSGLFAAGRKNDSEKLTAFLAKQGGDNTVVMLFAEDQQPDRRGRLYKKAAELGRAVEFKAQTEQDLIKWICGMAGRRGVGISPANAALLLRTVAGSMDLLEMELDKLAAFKNAAGEINRADIEIVCAKALDTRIFELVDAVGRKDARKAMNIFANLMLMKEYPTVVLNLLSKRFGQILRCKLMQGRGESEIAAALKLHSFVVRECSKQGRNFTAEALMAACEGCFETENKIKTGQIAAQTGVELLILKYAAQTKSAALP